MAFSPTFYSDALQGATERIQKLCPFHESSHMRKLLSCILEKDSCSTPLRRESITVLIECFLLEVLEIVCGMSHRTRTHTETENEQKAAAILAYVQETSGIGVSVSDIASRFGISQRQLHRLFFAVTGHGLSETIALEKLRKIEDLIGTTTLSFSEIAEICGFSDGYAMNKFFKRHNKVNLSEFRALANRKQQK